MTVLTLPPIRFEIRISCADMRGVLGPIFCTCGGRLTMLFRVIGCVVLFTLMNACGKASNSCSWEVKDASSNATLTSGSNTTEGDDQFCRSLAEGEINRFCTGSKSQTTINTTFEWKGESGIFSKQPLVSGTLHSNKSCGSP